MIVYSRVTVANDGLPVSVEDVKIALRIDGSNEDTYIQSLIRTATRLCETYTGLSFLTQTRTVKLDYFKGNDILLPYGPVTAVASVAYLDTDDTSAMVDSSDYTLDIQSGVAKIRVKETWPDTNMTSNNVVVTYTAGYANAGAIPEQAKEGIKRVCARLYQNRGDVDDGPVLTPGIIDILDPIKVYWDAEY